MANINIVPTAMAGTIQRVEVTSDYTTEAEALAILADFPKSAGLKIHRIGGDADCWTSEDKRWKVYMIAQLCSNGANGGVNETGLKRVKTIRRVAAAKGYTVAWPKKYANAVTEAEFDAAPGA